MYSPFNFSGFSQQYSVYPVACMGQMSEDKLEEMERKGYMVMPPSALAKLAHLEIELPMVFKLRNNKKDRESHSGVLEFVAEEGRVYMPHWMMQNLQLEAEEMITVSNVALPPGSFAKFEPQSVDFLDIADPRAVFERALRSYSCLTEGDIIAIHYNEKIYKMRIVEAKPKKAIKIIECDLQVDFAPPVGYVEPEYIKQPEKKREKKKEEPKEVDITERVFPGSGFRIDGKKKKSHARIIKKVDGSDSDVPATTSADIIANNHEVELPNSDILEYKKGYLEFYPADEVPLPKEKGDPKEPGQDDNKPKSPPPFQGTGQRLK